MEIIGAIIVMILFLSCLILIIVIPPGEIENQTNLRYLIRHRDKLVFLLDWLSKHELDKTVKELQLELENDLKEINQELEELD
jgi:hypothetical protein